MNQPFNFQEYHSRVFDMIIKSLHHPATDPSDLDREASPEEAAKYGVAEHEDGSHD